MSNQTTYAYDLSGNIVKKVLANGLTEVRSHDGRNRVSTLKNQNSAGTDIAGYAYQYDAAGNVMEVVEDYPAGNLPGRTITNAYDGVYRLTSEEIATSGGSTVTTEYEYDKGHNRTSKAVSGGATTTYVIGDGTNGAGANQIVSATTGGVTTAYGYDANGNRSSRTVDAPLTGDTTNGSVMITGLASTTGLAGGMAVSGTGIPSGATVANIASSTSVTLSVAATATATGTTITFGSSDTYHYDDENRLIQLVDENGANPGTYIYGYDYRTRRVARTEPGPVTTNIVFDGGISIIEYGPAGAASPNVEYVRGHDYGGGVGGLEYSVRNGTPSFNFYDSRGDVTTQTDASATVTFQTGYEAFGNQTTTNGSTQDRQKASTKEQDPTGLLNEGFRYRDPETGTFLTRDPLGFKAGPNMYTYVHQNPWTHFDPEGLDSSQPNPAPPPPPPPPAKTSANTPPPKQTGPANQPAATGGSGGTPMSSPLSDLPKLSFDMRSEDQKVAAAAKDLGLLAPPTDSARYTSGRIKQGLEGLGALAGAVIAAFAMVPTAGSTVVDGPIGIAGTSLLALGVAASWTYGMANLGAAFSPNTPRANETAAKVEEMPSSFNQLVGLTIAGKPGQNYAKVVDFGSGIATGGADILKASTVRESADAALGYSTTLIDATNQLRDSKPSTSQRPGCP